MSTGSSTNPITTFNTDLANSETLANTYSALITTLDAEINKVRNTATSDSAYNEYLQSKQDVTDSIAAINAIQSITTSTLTYEVTLLIETNYELINAQLVSIETNYKSMNVYYMDCLGTIFVTLMPVVYAASDIPTYSQYLNSLTITETPYPTKTDQKYLDQYYFNTTYTSNLNTFIKNINSYLIPQCNLDLEFCETIKTIFPDLNINIHPDCWTDTVNDIKVLLSSLDSTFKTNTYDKVSGDYLSPRTTISGWFHTGEIYNKLSDIITKVPEETTATDPIQQKLDQLTNDMNYLIGLTNDITDVYNKIIKSSQALYSASKRIPDINYYNNYIKKYINGGDNDISQIDTRMNFAYDTTTNIANRYLGSSTKEEFKRVLIYIFNRFFSEAEIKDCFKTVLEIKLKNNKTVTIYSTKQINNVDGYMWPTDKSRNKNIMPLESKWDGTVYYKYKFNDSQLYTDKWGYKYSNTATDKIKKPTLASIIDINNAANPTFTTSIYKFNKDVTTTTVTTSTADGGAGGSTYPTTIETTGTKTTIINGVSTNSVAGNGEIVGNLGKTSIVISGTKTTTTNGVSTNSAAVNGDVIGSTTIISNGITTTVTITGTKTTTVGVNAPTSVAAVNGDIVGTTTVTITGTTTTTVTNSSITKTAGIGSQIGTTPSTAADGVTTTVTTYGLNTNIKNGVYTSTAAANGAYVGTTKTSIIGTKTTVTNGVSNSTAAVNGDIIWFTTIVTSGTKTTTYTTAGDTSDPVSEPAVDGDIIGTTSTVNSLYVCTVTITGTKTTTVGTNAPTTVAAINGDIVGTIITTDPTTGIMITGTKTTVTNGGSSTIDAVSGDIVGTTTSQITGMTTTVKTNTTTVDAINGAVIGTTNTSGTTTILTSGTKRTIANGISTSTAAVNGDVAGITTIVTSGTKTTVTNGISTSTAAVNGDVVGTTTIVTSGTKTTTVGTDAAISEAAVNGDIIGTTTSTANDITTTVTITGSTTTTVGTNAPTSVAAVNGSIVGTTTETITGTTKTTINNVVTSDVAAVNGAIVGIDGTTTITITGTTTTTDYTISADGTKTTTSVNIILIDLNHHITNNTTSSTTQTTNTSTTTETTDVVIIDDNGIYNTYADFSSYMNTISNSDFTSRDSNTFAKLQQTTASAYLVNKYNCNYTGMILDFDAIRSTVLNEGYALSFTNVWTATRMMKFYDNYNDWTIDFSNMIEKDLDTTRIYGRALNNCLCYNEKLLYDPLITLINSYLADNKYSIDEYIQTKNFINQITTSNLSYKSSSTTSLILDLLDKTINNQGNSTEYIEVNMEDIIFMLKIFNLTNYDIDVDKRNLLIQISKYLQQTIGTNLDTSINNKLSILLDDDITNTFENAKILATNLTVASAYKNNALSYSSINTYVVPKIQPAAINIEIRVDQTLKIINAYLTSDYTATGTPLTTYTLGDINNACRKACYNNKYYYIVDGVDIEATNFYFVDFEYKDGSYKLITHCVGHDSTGNSRYTKPSGWPGVPYKVYNPRVTVLGNLLGFNNSPSEDTYMDSPGVDVIKSSTQANITIPSYTIPTLGINKNDSSYISIEIRVDQTLSTLKAYLTSDYSATGTPLTTYTLVDVNNACRKAFNDANYYYNVSDGSRYYFAEFSYVGGTYQLETRYVGHDSTGNSLHTKPVGWPGVPYKVYNPRVTVYGNLLGFDNLPSEDTYRNSPAANATKNSTWVNPIETDTYRINTSYISIEIRVDHTLIKLFAYLTIDYTAEGTPLTTYTVDDVNNACRKAFDDANYYYLETNVNVNAGNLQITKYYFAEFIYVGGTYPYKLITHCVGHDSTGNSRYTRPSGWPGVPYKVYNPRVTVYGNLLFFTNTPTKDTYMSDPGLDVITYSAAALTTTVDTTTIVPTIPPHVISINIRVGYEERPLYAYLTSNYTSTGTPLTTYTLAQLNSALYKAFDDAIYYYNVSDGSRYYFAEFVDNGTELYKLITHCVGHDSTGNSRYTRPSGWPGVPYKVYNPRVTVYGNLLTFDNLPTEDTYRNSRGVDTTKYSTNSKNDMQIDIQSEVVNCAVIASEIEFAIQIKNIDDNYVLILNCLNTLKQNTTDQQTLENIQTLNDFRKTDSSNTGYNDDNKGAISGKGLIDDANTILQRYNPIDTLNISKYIEVYDSASSTQFEDRCYELTILSSEYKGLKTSLDLSQNVDIQTDLLNYVVTELYIMKVNIGDKYTILPSSDPNKTAALNIKNIVDGYYSEAVDLQAGFSTSTTQTTDFVTIVQNYNDTLLDEVVEMDGYLKSSLDSFVNTMVSNQGIINSKYASISTSDSNYANATALNTDANTCVTDSQTIQTNWSSSSNKLADYTTVLNNNNQVISDKETINGY